MVAVGSGSIVRLCEPLDEQPAAVCTVTERPTEPLAPALKVMVAVPVPLVMVPLVIPQEYVAPAPAFGTDAVCPDELAQTDDGAVIVASGSGSIVTLVELLVEQPAEVWTVTERPTGPEAEALKVMVEVPAPAVMVPLVIPQE
jgi:D-arabinose 5-phosphate isomerase GutQ